MPADGTRKLRPALTRERILRAAVDLADEQGLDALSMRGLAAQLGAGAMSLYNHVQNRDDLIDGILDLLVDQIEVPPDDTDWRTSIRARAIEIGRAHV